MDDTDPTPLDRGLLRLMRIRGVFAGALLIAAAAVAETALRGELPLPWGVFLVPAALLFAYLALWSPPRRYRAWGYWMDGEELRLGGLDRVRSTEIVDRPTGCEFTLPGRDLTVSGRVSAEAKDFVAWRYADPDGGEHNTLNCSIADLELTVERQGRESRRLELRGGGAYEIGMKETDHGIPVQPYADG